jgi:hypothetical protein
MTDFVKVDLQGPLLSRDAQRQAKRAVTRVVSAVAKEGKREVQQDLTKGHGKDTGEYRRGVRRKLGPDRMSARVFARDGRKAAWLEGTSKLNRKSVFKGYSVFAHATARLEASRAGQGAMARIVKDLGG